MRRQKAEARGVPPFVVFSDATLRGLAARRPSTPAGFRAVHGIGDAKAAEYADDFLRAIADYCSKKSVPMDVAPPLAAQPAAATTLALSSSSAKRRAFELFEQGQSIDDVCQAIGRARSTVTEYLTDFIASHEISDASSWLDPDLFERIRAASQQRGLDRLKPLYEAFGGQVPYDQLRIAVACLKNCALIDQSDRLNKPQMTGDK